MRGCIHRPYVPVSGDAGIPLNGVYCLQKGENYRIMVTILEECEVKDDGRKDNGKIVALAKTRGFVYPGSEIYGGLANTWDYGNLGVELKIT